MEIVLFALWRIALNNRRQSRRWTPRDIQPRWNFYRDDVLQKILYTLVNMPDDLIPDEIKQFLIENIDSIAELEGLLLLRSNPNELWSANALAQRLYATQEQIENVLARLQTLGFLAIKGDNPTTYFYKPRSAGLAQTVDRIAEVYSKYLIPVTNLIHAKSETRIQEFADAFKLRKKDG